MRFRTFQGARSGINDAVRALSAPGGGSYNDTMRDLAYVDSAQAGARRDDSETSLNQQKLDARNSIAAALQGVPLPQGMTPDVVSSLFVGSENPSFRDYTQGMVDMGGTQAQRMALEAAQRGDTGAMNRFNTIAKPGETYEPFAMTEAGVIDQGTGAYSVSDLARARENQANAAAGASAASGRASDALAAQRGFLEVSPGATVYGITGNPVVDALPGAARTPPSGGNEWRPNPSDLRADGTQKGNGWLGALPRPGGGVSSEISVGVNLDGKETEMPLMVPGLSPEEQQWLLTNDPSDPKFAQSIPDPIMHKAVTHARQRIAQGLSPFAQPGEGAPPPAAPAGPVNDALTAVVTAPPTLSQQGGPTGKPTESSRKYSELIALGVPPETARGTAYGTIRQVTDARGNVVLVDVASTNVLGTLKTDPRTGQTAWEPSQAPSTAAPGGIAQPTTQAEYDALPSGAIFIDPDDGQQYRKP